MLRSQQAEEETGAVRRRIQELEIPERQEDEEVVRTEPVSVETQGKDLEETVAGVLPQKWRGLWKELVSENPIYRKECRTTPLQKRKTSRGMRLVERGLLLSVLVGAYYGLFYALFLNNFVRGDARAQEGLGLGFYTAVIALMGLTLVLAPASAAAAIPKERVKQTWNALLLTRLSPQQILLGKLLPHYRGILTFLLVMLPALLICGVVGKVPIWSFLLTTAVMGVTSALSGLLAVRSGLLQRAPREMHRGPWAWAPTLAVISPAITMGLYTMVGIGSALLGPGQVSDPGPAFHWLAVLGPNLLNPLTSFAFSLPMPWDQIPVPLALRLAVCALYLTTGTLFARGVWRRTLEQFWKAPKDNSG